VTEPLTAVQAKALIRVILDGGTVTFSTQKLARHGLTTIDASNVLRAGVPSEAEWENGEWRHQVHTGRMVVVVHFESETELRVITGWRKQ
jgi:hypothetical protein